MNDPSTAVLLLLPKLAGAAVELMHGGRGYGGRMKLLGSVAVEFVI